MLERDASVSDFVEPAEWLAFSSLRNSSLKSDEVLVESPEGLEVLLRAALAIKKVLLDREHFERFQSRLFDHGLRESQIRVASRDELSKIVGYKLHRGVMALAERPSFVSPEELPFPIIALNGLTDAENVGSIIRSAHAFGVTSFLVDSRTADPLLRRAIRVSCGASLVSKVAVVEDLSRTLLRFPKSVLRVAVDCGENSRWSDFPFARESIYVFGKEKGGLEPSVKAACDARFSIPMSPTVVNSINVASSAAIILSHVQALRG